MPFVCKSLLITLLLCAHHPILTYSSLSVLVTSGETRCFFLSTSKNEQNIISGSYEMLDDDLLPHPIHVTIYNKETDTISYTSRKGRPEGLFRFNASGKYELCIGNGSPRPHETSTMKDDVVNDDHDRRIMFSIRVHPLYEGTDVVGPMTKRTASTLELTGRLRGELEALLDRVEYLKSRDAAHMNIVDNTLWLVLKWTILEAFLLVGISLGQVFYLRKLLST